MKIRLWKPVEGFFLEVGRNFSVFGRVLAWTPRPPYDVWELLRQMIRIREFEAKCYELHRGEDPRLHASL